MNSLERAAAYLAIPQDYAESLSIRWANSREVIEFTNGTILAFRAELQLVLDGVFATQPAVPFAFVVDLLHAMKMERSREFSRLREVFEATRVTANRRNVGLLIAELCRGLPTVAGELSGSDIAGALLKLQPFGDANSKFYQEPPLSRTAFDEIISGRLAKYSNADLEHWLTHGTGPSPAGEQLATETESLPVRVARLLQIAKKRQRLVGAAVLVPALDAAITFPPRRRSPEAPPQGGYCDVTTRGDPDRLLPSQFALDPDEFIRRFAAKELLYFQREAPHQPDLPERVIVLDQGVRTWGSVRLALAAAAFSLLVPRAKRCASVRLFLTSARGALDITGQDADAVADMLEASDLSPHPLPSLQQALKETEAETTPHDIILLTHPRSVREVSLAPVLNLRPNDRMFALSVDDHGKAELSEWLPGGLATIRSFRVDLEAAEKAKPEEELHAPRPIPGAIGEWAGDVEPAPFPFRLGLIAEPQMFGFDAAGEWLVVVSQNGILHGLAFDGSPAEVLPRAFHGGVMLDQVDAVLGVNGGVVVCGRINDATQQAEQIAVHYDRESRRVTSHFLGPALLQARWTAYPDLHCVAIRTESVTGRAVDLGTGGQYSGVTDTGLVSRARAAWDRSGKGGTPPFTLIVQNSAKHPGGDKPYLEVSTMKHSLQVRQADASWGAPFVPQYDGKPLLSGATIHSAQLAGDVLALSLLSAGQRKLMLFRGPSGAILGEVTHSVRYSFGLSPDGKRLARRDAMRSVIVCDSNNPSRAVATAPHAALHNALDIRLDAEPFRLTIAIGTFAHTFRLLNGELRYSLALGWDNFPEPKVPLTAKQTSPIKYDETRFPAVEGAASGVWRAVLDRLGQVLLYANDELIAAFVVRRERAAAWIPGGVYWGTPALIGGPATPDAEKRIGRRIQSAGG